MTPDELDVLKRVDSWFDSHRDEFISDLIDWVNYPSVSDNSLAVPGAPFGSDVQALFDRVVDRANELGFATETHEGYAISVLGGGDGEEIGFVSHLDVVPAGENWTLAPFEAFYRDGFVLGRGASDNKGPALVDLYLLRAVRDLNLRLSSKVRVIYGGAEEVGMADLSYYAQNYPVPRLSIISDGGFPVNFAQKGNLIVAVDFPAGSIMRDLKAGVAVNAVPAGAEIVLKGIDVRRVADAITTLPEELRERLTVTPEAAGTRLHARGLSGHAAFPEGTLNGILVLADALTRSGLLEGQDYEAAAFLTRVLDKPFGDDISTPTHDTDTGVLTHAGCLIGPHGDGLRLYLDIRYPVSTDSTVLVEALTKAAQVVNGRVTIDRNAAPVFIDRESPLVRLLQTTFNTLTGTKAEPFSMGGGTHARVLPNSITFGPGFGRDRVPLVNGEPTDLRPDFIPAGHGFPHGPDEFVLIENLKRGLKIYVVTLLRLDSWLHDA